MSHFVPVDRDTAYLLPPSVDECLPDDHLARFVVEVIGQLDLGELTRQYAGRGSAAHHPAVLLGLLIYGNANGVHSSRKMRIGRASSSASSPKQVFPPDLEVANSGRVTAACVVAFRGRKIPVHAAHAILAGVMLVG
jgi:hypothetical protein